MRRRSIFQWARLKLTLFYLAGLLLLSLGATMTIRYVAEREYLRSNHAQLGEVQYITRSYLYYLHRPDQSSADLQQNQASLLRAHLNEDLVLFNLAVLLAGGAVSYWFAGRTLRPIEEAHEAQARFTADASHELRTPLTNMRLENELFLRQKQFTDQEAREQIKSNLEEVERLERLSQIKSNLEEVERLERLSQNLLDLNHFEQSPLQRAATAVMGIVTSAVQQAEHLAQAKQVRLVADDIEPAEILANPDSMVQLLGILLDNAIKYGPARGTVTITGERFGSAYVLTVSDQGKGIAEEDLPYIFDRLYRGDKARSQTAGYGLGLSVAREIARANNAAIAVKNGPQGGAIFGIRIEVAQS